MNKFQFLGHWNQVKGKLKQKFGKLTDDDLMKIDGNKDVLIGKLQSLYGLNREKIEEQLREFQKGYYGEQLLNHWNLIQTKLKQKWNSLTEDDIQRIKGKADQLIAQLQARYHFDRPKAEEELYVFINSLDFSKDVSKEKVGAHGKEHKR